MKLSYRFETLGCKVNSYESEAMAQALDLEGFYEAKSGQDPDIVIVNTCTVTGASDAKSRQIIRRNIRKYPQAIHCVVGCYAQLAGENLSKIPGVSIVIGTSHRINIPSLVQEYLTTRQPIIRIEKRQDLKNYEPLQVTSYHDITRAYLKIQDGCNNWCSYCIIPQSRGPMRSRPSHEVIDEAKRLVGAGFQEIVLTGIHTAGYGLDLENYDFADLLDDLLREVPTLKRLRISSIEASEISPKLIDLMQRNPVIVNHLHIPLQSGSNTVLKRMHRHYTSEEFLSVIHQLRLFIPNISITTDVIVGFPGESEQEFEETVQLIRQAKFSKLHVFPFSPRNGTLAATMIPVEDDIKKERVHRLLHLSTDLERSYAQQFEGKILSVLVETFDKITSECTGHTSNYLKIRFPGFEQRKNTFQEIRLLHGDTPICHGIIETKREGK